jgi:hypothetical protein
MDPAPRSPLLRRLALALGAAGLMGLAPLARAELPQYDGNRHMGVSTCTGSPCHGKTAPGAQSVLQNEYATWNKYDKHANAYRVLHNEASQRMARNLGLSEPAHQADLCLDCHANNVPQALRGPKFDIERGVGCEACHGGSERWLKPHDTGRPHKENVADGLYPTSDPVKRAELCVSCHYGTDRKFVNHRLMGAGHPRMSFELQVFSMTQPAHFQIDGDYTKRGKTAAEGVQVWAIGQAIAVRQVVDALLDPKRGRDGIWPELVHFDCHACHHAMSEKRWRARPSTGLPPGVARLDDSSFLMLRHALAGVDPTGAQAFRDDLRALHAATVRGGLAEAAGRIRTRAQGAIPKFAAWKVDAAGIRRVLQSLVAEGISGEYLDYAGGEQAALAIQAVVDNLYGLGALSDAKVDAAVKEMNDLLILLDDPERYNRQAVVASFTRLAALLEIQAASSDVADAS